LPGVVSRVAAIVFVLGVIPASLWVAGVLPPEQARDDLVAFESRTTSAEQEWRARVGTICGWERQQNRAFERAFRKASTPADVQLLFEAAIRLSDESLAIFGRLKTPLQFRGEARTLRRLLREERNGIKNALDALNAGQRAAFLRSIKAFVEADAKSSRLLVELGIDGCKVQPVTVPEGERARIV
jgi:hypothetical protein